MLIQSQQANFIKMSDSIQIVCISIFHAAPEAQIRLLSRIIRRQFPDKKLIIALWSCADIQQLDEIKGQV